MKLRIETYYDEDDKQFYSDYYSIAIFNEAGEKIAHYGDYYHDKGREKVEGFIDGLKYALKEKITVKRVNIANGETG